MCDATETFGQQQQRQAYCIDNRTPLVSRLDVQTGYEDDDIDEPLDFTCYDDQLSQTYSPMLEVLHEGREMEFGNSNNNAAAVEVGDKDATLRSEASRVAFTCGGGGGGEGEDTGSSSLSLDSEGRLDPDPESDTKPSVRVLCKFRKTACKSPSSESCTRCSCASDKSDSEKAHFTLLASTRDSTGSDSSGSKPSCDSSDHREDVLSFADSDFDSPRNPRDSSSSESFFFCDSDSAPGSPLLRGGGGGGGGGLCDAYRCSLMSLRSAYSLLRDGGTYC